jgi:hypothetical protein
MYSPRSLRPAWAQACSRDDAIFYETFLDPTCLQLPLNNTTLDALGGLRLATNGTAATTRWDSDVDLNAGVSYEGKTFGPVGVRTLAVSGTARARACSCRRRSSHYADGANPVLAPTAATVATTTMSTTRPWRRSARHT